MSDLSEEMRLVPSVISPTSASSSHIHASGSVPAGQWLMTSPWYNGLRGFMLSVRVRSAFCIARSSSFQSVPTGGSRRSVVMPRISAISAAVLLPASSPSVLTTQWVTYGWCSRKYSSPSTLVPPRESRQPSNETLVCTLFDSRTRLWRFRKRRRNRCPGRRVAVAAGRGTSCPNLRHRP